MYFFLYDWVGFFFLFIELITPFLTILILTTIYLKNPKNYKTLQQTFDTLYILYIIILLLHSSFYILILFSIYFNKLSLFISFINFENLFYINPINISIKLIFNYCFSLFLYFNKIEFYKRFYQENIINFQRFCFLFFFMSCLFCSLNFALITFDLTLLLLNIEIYTFTIAAIILIWTIPFTFKNKINYIPINERSDLIYRILIYFSINFFFTFIFLLGFALITFYNIPLNLNLNLMEYWEILQNYQWLNIQNNNLNFEQINFNFSFFFSLTCFYCFFFFKIGLYPFYLFNIFYTFYFNLNLFLLDNFFPKIIYLYLFVIFNYDWSLNFSSETSQWCITLITTICIYSYIISTLQMLSTKNLKSFLIASSSANSSLFILFFTIPTLKPFIDIFFIYNMIYYYICIFIIFLLNQILYTIKNDNKTNWIKKLSQNSVFLAFIKRNYQEIIYIEDLIFIIFLNKNSKYSFIFYYFFIFFILLSFAPLISFLIKYYILNNFMLTNPNTIAFFLLITILNSFSYLHIFFSFFLKLKNLNFLILKDPKNTKDFKFLEKYYLNNNYINYIFFNINLLIFLIILLLPFFLIIKLPFILV